MILTGVSMAASGNTKPAYWIKAQYFEALSQGYIDV